MVINIFYPLYHFSPGILKDIFLKYPAGFYLIDTGSSKAARLYWRLNRLVSFFKRAFKPDRGLSFAVFEPYQGE